MRELSNGPSSNSNLPNTKLFSLKRETKLEAKDAVRIKPGMLALVIDKETKIERPDRVVASEAKMSIRRESKPEVTTDKMDSKRVTGSVTDTFD